MKRSQHLTHYSLQLIPRIMGSMREDAERRLVTFMTKTTMTMTTIPSASMRSSKILTTTVVSLSVAQKPVKGDASIQPVSTYLFHPARSLSGLPPRPEPHPPQPQPRSRFHSYLYASPTIVSSNSLVSESAAEHRRTNARAQLRSEMFSSRPSLDEPPRDAAEITSLTAAARLRRIVANQTDAPSSSNAPSRPPSSGRTSNHPSRPFSFNGSGPPSQFPRGGLDDRERVRFAEILSDRRHPQTRGGSDRSPSRDRNHISTENSLDSIFHPVFGQVGALPEYVRSAEGEAQPPYVYRSPTPPLPGLRTLSRSPPTTIHEPPGRTHPFSNVNLDDFPPGIYRDSLRRSIQANQGRSNPRLPEYEPPTFTLGNSDEDNDSDGDDMDIYSDDMVPSFSLASHTQFII